MQLPQSPTTTTTPTTPPPSLPPPPPLLTLPPELHLLILPHLPYPDALALKHTHPHFYTLIDTNVRLKVAWLLERKARNLEWPLKKCNMKTDAAFCTTGGGQVRRIMEKRRAHGECRAGDRGCEVVVGASCGGGRGFRKGGRRGGGGLKMSLSMWVFGLLVMSLVANLCFAIRLYRTNYAL